MTTTDDNVGRKIIANDKAGPYGIQQGDQGVIDEYVAPVDQYKVRFDDGRLALVSSEAVSQYFYFADQPCVPAGPDQVTCGLCGEQLSTETDVSPRTGGVVCWKCGWVA